MRQLSFSYRSKIIYLIIGSIIGLASIAYTNYLAKALKEKEKREMGLWARSLTLYDRFHARSTIEDDIMFNLINTITEIPAVMTDDYLRVIHAQNIDPQIVENPQKLRKLIEGMCSSGRQPIEFTDPYGTTITVFYGDSALLKSIQYFPFIQLSLITVLISFAFITFRSSKQNEQNRVWVGMAKETAHQLGTPTSSLLGWIEYIKSQDLIPEVTEEMSKDITRLMKVADRFGKIGSSTLLVPRNIYEVVSNTVTYFKSRIPRNVTLNLEQLVTEPVQANINDSLFEWVIENLLKNALDALQGKGEINVVINLRDSWVVVDVQDTGKGMPKTSFKRIFRPGYSTKTRGWGLGLSLSKRIVEEYHYGRIFVKESEIGKGTTFRIMLKRV